MNPAKRARIYRENASHSTGPTSPEGKQTSAMNGFKHGLTGQRMILQNHEVEPYRQLTESLHSDYRPQTEIEYQLVQKIIDCNMRLNRAAAIDCNLMNIGVAENTQTTALHDEITESVIAQTRAWTTQADSFEKLSRYETRISRQMLHYMHELDSIQNLRKSQLEAAKTTSQTTESNNVNRKSASFRRRPAPDFIPRTMTAVSPAPGYPAPPAIASVIPIRRATEPQTSPSYPLRGSSPAE
jgi:hypothetical protein